MGNLSLNDEYLLYENDFLKAGESLRIRFLFPAKQLNKMEVTNYEDKFAQIDKVEEEYNHRLKLLDERMEQLQPFTWLMIIIAGLSAIFILFRHPNRYRGTKTLDELFATLEKIDPLFVSYVAENKNIQDHSLIASFFP